MPPTEMRASLTIAGAALWTCAIVVGASQPQPAISTARATAGRSTYLVTCAGCHLPDRSGRNEAPSLANVDFTSRWGGRPGDLAAYIQKTMPPTDAGSLTDEAAADLAAYLLQPAAADAAAQTDATPASTVRTGVIVAGEVKNYVPVTDEMLRNPPAGDWLMARRNYQGWSYSPLAEITRDNVKNLKLAWVWAMNEGGCERADAARPQRHHVPGEHRQHDPGARRRDWRSHLGEPHRSRRGRQVRRDAQHRHLSGQDHPRHHRRAARRARRANGPCRLGYDDRRQRERLRQYERADRDRRQGRAGADRLRQVQAGRLLHQRVRRGERQARLEVRNGRARRAAGRRHVGQAAQPAARGRRDVDHGHLRSGSEAHLLGRRAGEAVDAVSRGTTLDDKLLYTGSTVALRPADGSLAWFHQHAPAEIIRPRRGVRTRAGRCRRPEAPLHDREARHPLEARSRDRPLHQLQAHDLSRRFRAHRSGNRDADVPRRRREPEDRRVDPRVPEHRRRP